MDWYPQPARNETSLSRRDVLKATGVGVSAGLLGVSQFHPVRARDHSPPEYDIDVIRESVWVETETDTDDTGSPDRIHVDIARPASTESEPLPVVLRADPYDIPEDDRVDLSELAISNQDRLSRDMDGELYVPDDATGDSTEEVRPPREIAKPTEHLDRSYYYEQQLLPDGYCFAYASPIGTGLSTGCSTLGGEPEIESVRAVIDWLNGRATAYRTPVGNHEVPADWTTGTTGMLGGSYRGALANGVATTGVGGLETIVPIRSISNWYNYVRANGAVITPGEDYTSQGYLLTTLTNSVTTRRDNELCTSLITEMSDHLDWETGDYNDFWAERNYLPDVEQAHASTLIVHGMYDRNVRPRHFAEWVDALSEADLPYKAWVHQGGHDDPREHDNQELPWIELLRNWLDYWLKGIDNGVMDRPTAIVETPSEELVGEPDWPSPESEPTPVRFSPAGDGPYGGLGRDSGGDTDESLVNDSSIRPTDLTETEHVEHRLVYRTEQLATPLRVSGTPSAQLGVSIDAPAAMLSVAVVDYGPEETEIINRGWMDPQNRNSLRESDPITPGQQYSLSFPMEPLEYVFEEGHRIGIMVYSSDKNVTKRPPSTPELTLSLAESAIELPVVGGRTAVEGALSGTDSELELYGDSYDYEGELYPQNFGDEGPDAYNRTYDPDAVGPGHESTPTATPDQTPNTTPDTTPTTTPDQTQTATSDSTPTTSDQTPAGESEEASGTAASADDGGPGFTVPGALGSLGGLGYLLKRRLGGDNETEYEGGPQ
jgi:X-Pro dipeptidyl-peptidase